MKKKPPVKKKQKIDQATVDAFSKKLKEWSETLPQEERSLVRLLVDRATAVNVGDLGRYDLKAKIRPDAEKLFRSLRGAVQASPAAVSANLDPEDLWLKSLTTTPSSSWTQNWDQSAAIIMEPGAARTKGGGSQ